MRQRVLTGALLLSLVLCLQTFSQSTNASLGGTVADASGALIPGVSVTVTNIQTGIVNTAVTNETGTYQFPSLQTGVYKVTADLPGFQAQSYSDVTLGIAQQVRLNFTLQVGAVAQTLDVAVTADTLIATTSASVGSVLPEYKVRDLPLANRNVIDLIQTTPNVRGNSFAGGETGMVITKRDGIDVGDGRYNNGAFSVAYTSPDLVEEVRVIVGPADAEMGRGSGQVQMVTRSGTNQFRGSAFWVNKNSVLDASTFSNNFNGLGKNYFNRNQYGARFGGPIMRNKTFFFFLYEGQRYVDKIPTVSTVLTKEARAGTYRFFPGVQSANANANNPTVDLNGNPILNRAPATPQAFNVFTRDPARTGFDPTGWVQSVLARMPLPNDFTVGDGLNTAGHRFVRRGIGSESVSGTAINLNRNQANLRVDHNVHMNHKLSFVASRERTETGQAIAPWPGGVDGKSFRHPQVYSVSLVSTLSPSLLNELRLGLRRGVSSQPQPFELDGPQGQDAASFLRYYSGMPVIIKPTLFESYIFNDANGAIGTRTPLWVYGDNVSWTHGKHALKFGGEYRYGYSNSWGSDEIIPRINLGPSSSTRQYFETTANQYGLPVQGIDGTSINGLSSADAQRARDLLTDLSGSVAQISQAFNLRQDPRNLEYLDYNQLYKKIRETHLNEFSGFIKDDWKIKPDVTLNFGVRWEYYGTPYATVSLIGAPVGGGTAGAFGISGTSWADWHKPGAANGTLTQVEFVGKHSPNPDVLLHNNDLNNFAPAMGMSWSLPWFGKGKTVLRMGYGVSYQGRATSGAGLTFDTTIANMPGMHQFGSHPFSTFANLTNIGPLVPIPERYPSGKLPTVNLTARNEALTVYDTNTVNPYVQNFNVELQREVARNLTVEVRYLGSKGTKLYGGIDVNTPIVLENGFLQAFIETRQGGNAPLFDQMLQGLNLGLGAVNGTAVTGSASLRQNASTRTLLANNNPGGL